MRRRRINQLTIDGEAQGTCPTNTSLPRLPEGRKQIPADYIDVTTNSAQLTQENRPTSILCPRLPEEWNQFLSNNVTNSSLPQYGTHAGNLNDEERLRMLEDELKRTRSELESTHSQAKQTQLVLEEQLKASQHQLAQQSQLAQLTAADSAQRARKLEQDLENARIQIDQLLQSAAASTPPNVSSKLHLQHGDYFSPYNPDLRQKATEVKIIGSGASGTVWQVCSYKFCSHN